MKVSSHIWRLVLLLISSFTSVIVLIMVVFTQEARAETNSPVLPCSAKQIKASMESQPYMPGQSILAIFYMNTSSTPCELYGWPAIVIKDKNGSIYETATSNITDISRDYYGSIESPVIVILPSIKKITAETALKWNVCGPPPKESLEVFITLPYDTTQIKVVIENSVDPAGSPWPVRKCSDATAVSQIRVGSFKTIDTPFESQSD